MVRDVEEPAAAFADRVYAGEVSTEELVDMYSPEYVRVDELGADPYDPVVVAAVDPDWAAEWVAAEAAAEDVAVDL